MLSQTLAQIESVLVAQSPEAASQRFFEALSLHGATYLQTRLYRRPLAALTSETHYRAGGVVEWPSGSSVVAERTSPSLSCGRRRSSSSSAASSRPSS